MTGKDTDKKKEENESLIHEREIAL